MNKTILLMCALCLSACDPNIIKPNPAPIVTEVKVPVRVDCLGELPQKPDFVTDKQLLEMKSADFVQALNVDRIKRDIYMVRLETAIEGCK